MKASNIKHIKSTILGTALIATGIYLLVRGITNDYYILGVLFASGILLWFAPDTYIIMLEKFIKTKTESKREN